jgi:ABC-type glycerol-3-phosphate transport system permease component
MATLAIDPKAVTAERNRRIREGVVRVAIYFILSFCAFLMLFPFIYMITTSLKQNTQVQEYPPRLLPYTQQTGVFNGEEVPLYDIDGRTMYLAEDGIRFGFFATEENINPAAPRESSNTIGVPIEQATATGETVSIGGEEFEVWSVPVEGQTEPQRLILAYRTALGRFVDVNDPNVSTYNVVRTAPQRETIDPRWSNYEAVFTVQNLGRSLVNTTVVTLLVTFGQVTTSLLGGYAFSRIRFAGRDALFVVYLGTIMIPFVVLIIPLYQLMVVIGWQDHLVSLILPWIFTAYGTFLMRQFFISIPKDLEEAAMLDGTTRFGILWRIFIPLSGPPIATQTINSFLWPLVIINEGTRENHVLTLAIRQLRNNFASEPNLVLTGAAIAVIPPLIVFILAQRYFIEGIANTGLK